MSRNELVQLLYQPVTLGADTACLDDQVQWSVAYPVESCNGPAEVRERWLTPLVTALPDLERRSHIAIDGDDGWSAGSGYFMGTFSQPLFGIPPTGKALYLRYTELLRFRDERIVEAFVIPDFLDAMEQAGVYPLRAPLGHSGLVLPPATAPQSSHPQQSEEPSQRSIRLIMDMLDGLRAYDGESLESMDLARFWHSDFMWYGPGGIGTTRGIAGFRAQHQGPFLKAFPDRDVDHHACTVARGDFVATGGWPHMHGTHRGGGWLGLPPTGRVLELRVMDIWRREGGLLKENWVAIDICHMLAQMGLDVFAQMHALKGGTGSNG